MKKEKKTLEQPKNTTVTPKTDAQNDVKEIVNSLHSLKELLTRIAVSLDKLYLIMPFKK